MELTKTLFYGSIPMALISLGFFLYSSIAISDFTDDYKAVCHDFMKYNIIHLGLLISSILVFSIYMCCGNCIASILFIGDFVEQFRKTAGKNVPLNIILQLTLFNFPNLITYTLPITSFFSSILALLVLIRNSELIVISGMGISNLKSILPALILHFFIGIVFITLANPLIAIFDDRYSNLKYEYIDRVDKFASITKNGLWLKQDNYETNLTSVLYAKSTEKEGKVLNSFMLLEYDDKGAFNGRIDGKRAELEEG